MPGPGAKQAYGRGFSGSSPTVRNDCRYRLGGRSPGRPYRVLFPFARGETGVRLRWMTLAGGKPLNQVEEAWL